MRSRFGAHKKRRLDLSAYAEPGAICSVTFSTRDRQPIFADEELARAAVDVLKRQASLTLVLVHGYCIMSDHVHLVLEPSPTCDIITFIGQYKNLAQREIWGKGFFGRVWQESFWDHFLRSDENLENVVRYVVGNPVRRQIVENIEDYPYAGSLIDVV